MAFEPLSYDSLKYVLQYMEPNKRFLISRCCPLIRTAERATPLLIDSLEFQPGKIIINNTVYSIGIYKKFHVGETPEPLKVQNDQGGVMFEVDKFGIKDEDDYTIVTPGDIEIGREFSLVRMRQAQAQAPIPAGFEIDIDSMEGIERSIQRYEERQAQPMHEGRLGRLLSGEYLEKMLQHQRAKLIPLHYRRDNAPTPFDNLIQVNVTSEGSKYIERYLHNKKYHEAVKQLGAALFDGRRTLINIRNFRAAGGHVILRLPIGVQFKIRNIQFRGSVTRAFEAFLPIIHESSYPLKHLNVDYFSTAHIKHPVVEGADMVTICSLKLDETIEPLSQLKNRRVHIINRFSVLTPFSINTLKRFIRDRIEGQYPVGSHLSLEFEQQNPVSGWMEEIRKELNGVAEGRSVTIPINDDSQLVVSYKETFDADMNRPNWTVEVLVEDPYH